MSLKGRHFTDHKRLLRGQVQARAVARTIHVSFTKLTRVIYLGEFFLGEGCYGGMSSSAIPSVPLNGRGIKFGNNAIYTHCSPISCFMLLDSCFISMFGIIKIMHKASSKDDVCFLGSFCKFKRDICTLAC